MVFPNDFGFIPPRRFFQNVKSIDDLPKEIVVQLEEFFVDYNKLEGKKFKAVCTLDARQAARLVVVENG